MIDSTTTFSFLRSHRIAIATIISALIVLSITATSAWATYKYVPKNFSLTSTCEDKMNRYDTMLESYNDLRKKAEKDYENYNDEDLIASIDERNKPRYTHALESLRTHLDNPLNIVVPECKPGAKFKYIENRRSIVGNEIRTIKAYLTTIYTIGDHNQFIAMCHTIDELSRDITRKSETFNNKRDDMDPLIESMLNQGLLDPQTIEDNKAVIDYQPPTLESLQIPDDCMDGTITHDNTSDKEATALEFRVYKRNQLKSIVDTLDKNIAALDTINHDYGVKLNDFEKKKAEQDAKLSSSLTTTSSTPSETTSEEELEPTIETEIETLEPTYNPEEEISTITPEEQPNLNDVIVDLYENLEQTQ